MPRLILLALSAAICNVLLALAAPSGRVRSWKDLVGSSSYDYDAWLVDGFGTRHPGSRAAFEANLAEIRRHNGDPANSWKKGVNDFTALTSAEFELVIGRGAPLRSQGLGASFTAATTTGAAAGHTPNASVDWRSSDAVTAVKDQQQCGGGWAFSATEAIESFVAIASPGSLQNLSVQQVIDCTPNPYECGGLHGCQGATQELAYAYVAGLPPAGPPPGPGITTDELYPYVGFTHANCEFTVQPAAFLSGFSLLPPNNYSATLAAVSGTGPLAVSVAATAWQFYESGVYSSAACGTNVNQGVQLVGYGTDSASGLNYWLIRNSWGVGWGEAGYLRLQRFGEGLEPCAPDGNPFDNNACVLPPPGPPVNVTSPLVCGLCGVLASPSYPIVKSTASSARATPTTASSGATLPAPPEVALPAPPPPLYPMLGYDPQRTGRSPLLGPATAPSIQWSFPTGDTVYSAPAIGGEGIIYFSSWDGNVYAVSQHGELIWVNSVDDYEDNPLGGVALTIDHFNRTILIVGGMENLYAVRAVDGAPLWRYTTEEQYGAPLIVPMGVAVSDATVAVVGGADYVWAVDTLRGELVWQYTGRNDFTAMSPSMSHDGTRIYANCDDGFLYALNASNGQELWSTQLTLDTPLSVATAVSNDDAFVYSVAGNDQMLWAVCNGTGIPCWHYDVNQSSYPANLYGSPAVTATDADGLSLVVLGGDAGYLYAFNASDGSLVSAGSCNEDLCVDFSSIASAGLAHLPCARYPWRPRDRRRRDHLHHERAQHPGKYHRPRPVPLRGELLDGGTAVDRAAPRLGNVDRPCDRPEPLHRSRCRKFDGPSAMRLCRLQSSTTTATAFKFGSESSPRWYLHAASGIWALPGPWTAPICPWLQGATEGAHECRISSKNLSGSTSIAPFPPTKQAYTG